MDKRTRSRLRKTLWAMLAYSPGEFRLVGARGGWIKISEAAKALHEEGLFRFVTEASLKQFVTLFCSDLFELDHDSSLIRCGDEALRARAFEYPVSFPPKRLFCAIRKRAAFSVEKGGLRPTGDLPWVVLCKDRDSALLLGKRRGAFEMAEVNSKVAEGRGVRFRAGGGSLYLADWIPPDAVSLSEELIVWMRMEEAARKERKRQKEAVEQDRTESLLSICTPSSSAGQRGMHPGSIYPTAERMLRFYDEKEQARTRFSRKRSKKGKKRRKGS